MRLQVELTDALQDYVADVSLREPDLLHELRKETSRLPLHLMQISPEQGQFMRTLLKAIGARRALEVGVFTGYSLLSTALALPDDGRVVGLDINEEWSAMALDYCKRAGVADKVDLHIGDARASLERLLKEENAAGTFDFVFIDADKDWYVNYAQAVLPKLTAGGAMTAHNVSARSGGRYRRGSMGGDYYAWVTGLADVDTRIVNGQLAVSIRKD
jgi:predicted O-methyltransferase YrrM